MNRLICALLLAASLIHAAGTAGNHATLVSIVSVQKNIDGKLTHLWPDEPFLVLGGARGLYLNGYGAVFTAEIYLAPAPMNVFQPSPTREMIARYRQRKQERVPQLEEAMREVLAQTASSLSTLADTDRVVLAVDLPSFAWEDSAGIPSQIIMQGQKSALLAATKDQLAAVIQTEVY
jgi:hypothetical protein